MAHMFNDLEGLRIAVEMEKRGENFYSRAALVSKNPETVAMLEQLAADERGHAAEFARLYAGELDRKQDADAFYYDAETNAYLSAIAADVVFPSGLMALRQAGFDDPAGVLWAAIASEKDSLLFYEELAKMSRDAHAKRVFEEIARQEKNHLRCLQAKLNEL